MKKRLSVALMVMVAGFVSADIGVQFDNNGGLTFAKAGGVVNQAFVQLVWSPTATAQADATDSALLGEGEYLLNSLTTAAGAAGTWGELGLFVYDDSDIEGTTIDDDAEIRAGYIFVRIFDNAFKGEGDDYLQQFVQAPILIQYDDLLLATVYKTDTLLGGTLGAGPDNHQVVPEPAVASLIVIFGGGLLVGRRIFFKG